MCQDLKDCNVRAHVSLKYIEDGGFVNTLLNTETVLQCDAIKVYMTTEYLRDQYRPCFGLFISRH